MKIEILGEEGCEPRQLEENTKEALKLLGIEADIVHITDSDDIRDYGVSETPCLVVDGEVLFEGKVSSPSEVRTWIVARGLER